MVVLYSTGCPKCQVLKKKLNASGMQYSACEDRDRMIQNGISEVPVLQIDDTYLNFKESVDFINTLTKAGKE